MSFLVESEIFRFTINQEGYHRYNKDKHACAYTDYNELSLFLKVTSEKRSTKEGLNN